MVTLALKPRWPGSQAHVLSYFALLSLAALAIHTYKHHALFTPSPSHCWEVSGSCSTPFTKIKASNEKGKGEAGWEMGALVPYYQVRTQTSEEVRETSAG